MIDDLLESLAHTKYFYKLNLASGYQQIWVAEKDIQKTTFSIKGGHYEWLVMSFGLTRAPDTFQGLMNNNFWDLLDVGLLVYLDDILIYSKTLEEHASKLR